MPQSQTKEAEDKAKGKAKTKAKAKAKTKAKMALHFPEEGRDSKESPMLGLGMMERV